MWLGKVWAARILEGDRAKYQITIEDLKSDLNKKIYEHNVAVSRIDAQRAGAIQKLYVSLVKCSEAAFQIMAPSNLPDDFVVEIPAYRDWANNFRKETEQLEILSMYSAISMGEETYEILSKCGHVISMLSIDFYNAAFDTNQDNDPDLILQKLDAAKTNLKNNFEKEYKPAKNILLKEFREIMDPRLAEVSS